MNTLFFGDNLQVLIDHIKDESVDLIYLDPPFNSQANYNVIFTSDAGDPSEAQAEAFRDTWKWDQPAQEAYEAVIDLGNGPAEVLSSLQGWLGKNGLMAYLSMMTVRLIELRRVLKDTGSLFLHCDPTASHYLKIILDAVFGHAGFRNEIAWCYRKWSVAARQFARNHDIVFFYSKGEKWTFNVQYIEPSKGTKKRWKGQKQLAVFNEDGVRQATSTDEEAATPCPDWWEISIINPNAKERVGYPTQKPLALLERIIASASNEGDVVLDPFCGCGTTIEAAQRLKRNWIGIDVTHYAVSLIEERLRRMMLSDTAYTVWGRPTEMAGAVELAKRDRHQFQWWASWLLGAQAYKTEKRGADAGVDGRIFFPNGPWGTGKIIISVKSGHVGVEQVRELEGVVTDQKAQMGILITLEKPTQPMRTTAAGYGRAKPSAHEGLPRIQIATVEDLLDGRLPNLPPIPKPVAGARSICRKTERDQLEIMFEFEGGKKTIKDDSDFIDPRFVSFG